MSRTAYKVIAIALLAIVLLGVSLLSSKPSYAATRTSSTVATQDNTANTANTAIIRSIIGIWHCGITSCSYYFTRHSTRVIADVGILATGFLAYVPSAVAAAIRLIVAAVNAKAWEASLKNQCLRVRVGVPAGLYSDGSGYCHN
jgi:hypothetical protein